MVTEALVSVKREIDAFVADRGTDRLEGRVVVDTLVGLFACYLEVEDPRDDTEELLQHVLGAATVVAGPTRLGDRTLVALVEARMRGLLDAQAMQPRLDEMLGAIEIELQFGVDSARERLVALCTEGRWTVPEIFTHHRAQVAVVELAARHRCVDALEAALTRGSTGNVASNQRNPLSYVHALNLLGHLAADPCDPDGSAAAARAALIRLTEDMAIAADASARLPAHLMSSDNRAALCAAYEDRFDRLASDGWDPELDPNCRSMAATLFAWADVARAD